MHKRLGVIPVLNEEAVLEDKVMQLYRFLEQSGTEMDIVIADNASDDRSPKIAKRLSERLDNVSYRHIPKRGKWNAIKYTWLNTDFDDYSVYCFMDTDMATDPEAIPRMFSEFDRGADIVIGSRYLPESDSSRTKGRLKLSKGFIYIANAMFGLGLSDYQCGFKGVNSAVRNNIVPLCNDGRFFMDTELLVRAYDNGYRIVQLPVRWSENEASSSVNYYKEVPAFLLDSLKLKYEQLRYGLSEHRK